MGDAEDFDPFDMDREEFNPNLCMLRYCQECSLPNLLARKLHIDNEIRNFSSNVQDLLYDNYQKFISATSVVTNMKTDFQKMEQEMDNLEDKMNSIGKTSSRILENLRPAEGEISKLLKCQDTMKKLVLLTDLVPTLRTHIDSGTHGAAARHYLKAENVLKKYRHLPSLDGIVKDCAEIVALIRSALRNKLDSQIYGKEELSETLNLLLALGETPVPTLEHFLAFGNRFLAALLTSMDETWVKDLKDKKDKERLMNAVVNYVNSCCNYIEKLSKVIEVVKGVFLSRKDLNDEACINALLGEFSKSNMNGLASKLLRHMEESFQDADDNFLSQILDKFVRQCHVSGILTRQINLYHEGMDIVLQICTSRCDFHLQKIKEDIDDQLFKLSDELSPAMNVHNLLFYLREWTEQKLMVILQSVVCYIRPEFRCCREVAFRKEFVKTAVRESIFIAFFRHIIQQTWFLLSSRDTKKLPKTLLCAVLARFHLDLQNSVPQFLSKVDHFLSSTTEKLSLTTAKDISTEFKNSAQKIIKLYVDIRVRGTTRMIQKSSENKMWMKSKEPTRPRAVVKMILNDVEEAKTEIEKTFGVCESPPRKRGSDRGSPLLLKIHPTDESAGRSTIEERMLLNKIFTESSKLSLKVKPNASSIVNCLLEKTLNSFVQFVRFQIFNHFSLQQIQIDVYYLHCRISNLIDFESGIQSLLDEIISSAYNRTLKPQLMNNKVVSAICSDVI